MGKHILTYSEFIRESEEGEASQADRDRVHSILLANRDRIKDETNIDDYLFNQVVDKMTKNPPKDVSDEDVVGDAIVQVYLDKPEAEPYMKLDQGDRMSDDLYGQTSGKSGVAVQNYDNQGSGDSGV